MSRRNLYILGGLALVIVAVGYYFLLLKPVRAEIATTQTAIAAEQKKLDEARQKLAQLQEMQRQAAANQAKLIALAKMMPASDEVPSLLIQIQDLATESGIDFMTITPGAATASPAYAAMPLSLEFSGTFFDINDFLYRVEQMVGAPGRLLAVSEVSLALPGEDGVALRTSPVLDVMMTIDAFQFVPSAVPDPVPDAGAAPGQPGSTNTAGVPGSSAASTEQG